MTKNNLAAAAALQLITQTVDDIPDILTCLHIMIVSVLKNIPKAARERCGNILRDSIAQAEGAP